MEIKIISEQKNIRLNLIHDVEDMNVYYSVSYKSQTNGEWINNVKFKPTESGFKTALSYYYRMILCEIDSNIIMDIDNDIHSNTLF